MSKSVESIVNKNDNVEKLIREMMDSISLLRVDVVDIRDRVHSIEEQLQKKNPVQTDTNVNLLAANACNPTFAALLQDNKTTPKTTGSISLFGKGATSNNPKSTVPLAQQQSIFGT